MKYIVHRRFKAKAICGNVNLPFKTECESDGSFISYKGKPLCCVTSSNAHQFFAVNDDGMGIIRGRLTQAIQKKLAERDADYQRRWDRIWDDALCLQYKRDTYDDYWLWNHDFFTADIETLRHIAKLAGVKEDV